MFEFNNLSKCNLHIICSGCLKMGEYVHRMSPNELHSYQTLIKMSSARTDVYMCNLCAYLFKKFDKFLKQCQRADSVLNNLSENVKEEFNIMPLKSVYDLSISDVKIVECPNFDKELDDFETTNIFDHDIYVDEEDIPLVMLKTEDVTVENRMVKKKKKKRRSQIKNGEIKRNKDTVEFENSFVDMETDGKIVNSESYRNEINDTIKIEKKLERVKKGKKKVLKDGFTSRMVQETDEYTVIKLSKEQVLKEMEEKSKSEEYVRSLYKCEKCVKGFNFEDVLRTHMERHVMKKGWLLCDLCQQYCPSVISLRGHMKSHTTKYKCKVCGCVRLSRQVLLEHYSTCHTSAAIKYTCQLCDFVSNKRTSMQRHVRTRHNKTEKHSCDQCGKTLNSLEALRVHITRHDKSKRVKCDECDRWFVYPSLLQQHKMAVHVRDDYYCVECNVKFKSRENLSLHFKRNRRHRDVSTFKHSCSICHKRFMFQSVLSSHVAGAHNDTKHACMDCIQCGVTFNRKSVYRAHMRTHADADERPFACECGATFAERDTLAAHGAKHHKKEEEATLLQNSIPSSQNEICDN